MTALVLTLPRQTMQHPSVTSGRTAAAALAFAAGAHLAAFPYHRSDGITAGFFLAVAVLQLTGATRVLGGVGRRAQAIMVVGNVALVALWVWSRTAGLPVGSHPGHAEAVGALDLTAVTAQVVAILAILVGPRSRPFASLTEPRLALLGLALVVGAGGAGWLPIAHADQRHAPSQHAPATAETAVDPYQPAPAAAIHTGQSGDEPIPQTARGHEHKEGHPHP